MQRDTKERERMDSEKEKSVLSVLFTSLVRRGRITRGSAKGLEGGGGGWMDGARG